MSYPEYFTEERLLHDAGTYNMVYGNSVYSKAHKHDFLEFCFVAEGSGYEVINGKKHKLKKGTMSIIFPGQVHQLCADAAGNFCFFNCAFTLDMFFGRDSISRDLGKILFNKYSSGSNRVDFCGPSYDEARRLLEKMLKECRCRNSLSDLSFKASFVSLMILFERQREESPLQKTEKLFPEKSIWEVYHYILTNYSTPFTLRELSQRFKYNPTYLCNLYRKTFGESIHTALNRVRVNNACSLLAASDSKILDICQEVGFSSYPTFCRVFHSIKGISPKEYRNKTIKADE